MPKGPPPRVHTTRGRLSCGAEQMGPSVSDAGRGGSHVRLEVSYPGDRLWTVLLAAASLHVGLAASGTVARAHWSQLHRIPLQRGGQGYGWAGYQQPITKGGSRARFRTGHCVSQDPWPAVGMKGHGQDS